MISKFKIMEEYPDNWNNLTSIPKGLEKFYKEEFEKWKLTKDDRL